MSTAEDVDLWAAVEAEYEERFERLATLFLVQHVAEQRRVDLERAEAALVAAINRARRARFRLVQATNLLEDAARLAAGDR